MANPSLTGEVGEWTRDLGSEISRSLQARILSTLFAVGATLSMLALAISQSSDASPVGLMTVVGVAYIAAIGLWLVEDSPDWLLPTMVAWGTVSITAVAWFSGDTVSPLIFFYLWVFLYSAYFFSRRVTLAEIGFAGVAYAGLLWAGPTPEAPEAAWWIVGMGTLFVGALVIALIRDRIEGLIGQLFESARRDPLTGLVNRRGFREQLDLELEQARRTESSISVLLADADHFKTVNDLSGHHTGDQVLKRLGRVLLERHGGQDVVARIGGEEFALLLPQTTNARAFDIAEGLRERVLSEFASEPVPITISFGIATFPEDGETAAALLRAGDEALYIAKQAGRNRSAVHDPSHGSLANRPAHHGANPGETISAERFVGVMLDLAETVDKRFSGTARHSETVGRYAEMMAKELGLDEERIGRVRLAGLLHDIGKVAISDSILHKPGPLTDAEFAKVREHPTLGAEILEHPSLADVRAWVHAHHERPDGQGYPLGLSGDRIPLEARIVAVADSYEAMTSVRSYKPWMAPAEAYRELRACAGRQFDTDVVEALIRALAGPTTRTGVGRARSANEAPATRKPAEPPRIRVAPRPTT